MSLCLYFKKPWFHIFLQNHIILILYCNAYRTMFRQGKLLVDFLLYIVKYLCRHSLRPEDFIKICLVNCTLFETHLNQKVLIVPNHFYTLLLFLGMLVFISLTEDKEVLQIITRIKIHFSKDWHTFFIICLTSGDKCFLVKVILQYTPLSAHWEN